MNKLLILICALLSLCACSNLPIYNDPIVEPHAYMHETYFDSLLRKGMSKEDFDNEWVKRMLRNNTRSGGERHFPEKYYYTEDGANFEVITYRINRDTKGYLVDGGPNKVRKEYVLFKDGIISDWGVGIMPNSELKRRLQERYPVNDGLFLEVEMGSNKIPESFDISEIKSKYIQVYHAVNYKGFDVVSITMARTNTSNDFKVAKIIGAIKSSSQREARDKLNALIPKIEEKFNQVIITKWDEDIQEIIFKNMNDYLVENKKKRRYFTDPNDPFKAGISSVGHIRTKYDGVDRYWYSGTIEKALSDPLVYQREWYGISEYFYRLHLIIHGDNTFTVSLKSKIMNEAEKISREAKRKNISERIEL